MKQNKKLIRNCWIILLALWAMYYFGGYYLSEEKCAEDILKAYYVKGAEKIMSLTCGDVSAHLYSDGEDENCVAMTKKYAFLHHNDSFIDNEYIKMIKERSKTDGFAYFPCVSADFGTTVFVYRYNKDIHLIHVELENGMSTVLEEWKEDFAGFALEHERMPDGSYVRATLKAYDKEGNLIGESAY